VQEVRVKMFGSKIRMLLGFLIAPGAPALAMGYAAAASGLFGLIAIKEFR
jgi:hypothetical protein